MTRSSCLHRLERMLYSALLGGLCQIAAPVMADEIGGTLERAVDAYRNGNLPQALARIEDARRLLLEITQPALAGYLPDAPDGWTRTIDADMTDSLAAMGGGIGAEAVYRRDDLSVTLVIVVNSPMATAMAGLFSNPGLLATAGELVRVGRQTFLAEGRQVSTVLDGRILVRAKGPGTETIVPLLQAIDYRALEAFGS